MAAARLGSAQRRAPAPSTMAGASDPPILSPSSTRPATRSSVAAAAALSSTSGLSAPARWIQQNLSSADVTREQRLGGSAWASFGEVELRDGRRFFVKTAGRDAAAAEMFRGEMLGLNALRDASDASGAGLAVPRVYYGGGGEQPGESAFIVMDYLDLGGGGGGSGISKRSLQSLLGEALARMHNAPVPPPADTPSSSRFGFPVDNTIGGTPQRNTWSEDWVEFYRERRLRFQLKLAGDAALTQAATPLLDNLHLMFNDYAPGGALEGELRPSVLHGDLWSGNYGPSRGDGGELRPAIFDPAVYFGHSEAEFGMSWCAGFSQEFYDVYFSVRPKAPGFEKRRDLYTLYHYLNHLNLFGGGYRSECARCLDRLSATIKGGGVPAR